MRSKSLPKQRIYIKLVLVLCVNRNVSKTDKGSSSPVFPVPIYIHYQTISMYRLENLSYLVCSRVLILSSWKVHNYPIHNSYRTLIWEVSGS